MIKIRIKIRYVTNISITLESLSPRKFVPIKSLIYCHDEVKMKEIDILNSAHQKMFHQSKKSLISPPPLKPMHIPANSKPSGNLDHSLMTDS